MEYSNFEQLSNREHQVLEHLIEGQTQQDIADSLYICVRTVKFHCGNIYQKLDVKNKNELIEKLNKDEVRIN